MLEQDLWKDIVHDPSNEAEHQRYANACVENNLEKEALLRYKELQKAYPAISDKFIKQLTTALEFKLMPGPDGTDGYPTKNSLLGRMRSLVHSILLTGIFSFAYGVIEKSALQVLIGTVIVVAYVGYMANRSIWTNKG